MRKILIVLFIIIIYSLMGFDLNKLGDFSYSKAYPSSYQNLVIQDSLLYTINTRSFQIYRIYQDSLSTISELNLQGELTTISINGDYVYVATDGSTSRLYRININNPFEPVITDTLFYFGSYAHFSDGNFLFIHEADQYTGIWYIHVYENDTFDEIACFEVPYLYHTMSKVTNGIALAKSHNEYYLYDISDPHNISELGEHSIYNTSYPYNGKIIQDSIFVFSSYTTGIKIYNISDYNNLNL